MGNNRLYPNILGVSLVNSSISVIGMSSNSVNNLWRYTIDKIKEYARNNDWGYFHRQVQNHIKNNDNNIQLERRVDFNDGTWGRIDIYDPRTNEMYEVKPFYHAAKGAEQINKYASGTVYSKTVIKK